MEQPAEKHIQTEKKIKKLGEVFCDSTTYFY